MTITALPTPPSRQDADNFSNRADAFLGALPTFATEANALAADVNSKQLAATEAANTATANAEASAESASEAANSTALASELVEKYLGAQADTPTTDKEGNPLDTGDWYIDTNTGFIKVFDGTTWVQGISAVAGVASINGNAGAIALRTINSQSLLGSGDLVINTEPGTNNVGYLNIPQVSANSNYTLQIEDAGKHIHKSSTSAFTWTIPANSAVAFPVGTAITFVNNASSGNATIAITSDTLRLSGPGTTGSRTLAPRGLATAIKVASTAWYISGTGLT